MKKDTDEARDFELITQNSALLPDAYNIKHINVAIDSGTYQRPSCQRFLPAHV